MEKRIEPLERKVKGGDKDDKALYDVMSRVLDALREGTPARRLPISREERPYFKELSLITAKRVLYVCNVGEDEAATGNAHSARVLEKAAAERAEAV